MRPSVRARVRTRGCEGGAASRLLMPPSMAWVRCTRPEALVVQVWRWRLGSASGSGLVLTSWKHFLAQARCSYLEADLLHLLAQILCPLLDTNTHAACTFWVRRHAETTGQISTLPLHALVPQRKSAATAFAPATRSLQAVQPAPTRADVSPRSCEGGQVACARRAHGTGLRLDGRSMCASIGHRPHTRRHEGRKGSAAVNMTAARPQQFAHVLRFVRVLRAQRAARERCCCCRRRPGRHIPVASRHEDDTKPSMAYSWLAKAQSPRLPRLPSPETAFERDGGPPHSRGGSAHENDDLDHAVRLARGGN
eukprot:169440-Chlamydomonas_euryale.AAC.4